jgi:5'-methylthioadenosine phosphorylase
MKIGIISGHKISDLYKNQEELTVETNFGDVQILLTKFKEHEIFFINRHGKKLNIPPNKINYRANIEAFAASHVNNIISIGTVGSMNKALRIGDIVIPHDFIDFTKSRPLTFFEDRRIHVDMTNPFCPSLRRLFIRNSKKICDIAIHENGVYLATEGPRLETASEIKMFLNYADIVGMTLVPEIVLAREKGLCYASICVICNMATGLQNKLTANEILEVYNEKNSIILKILFSTIETINNKQDCNCKHDLLKATL